MDAFYVSVELLRYPELRGRPVIVGGAGARGVVAAASYEARAYGVHSAMPSMRAKRLCPQAVFLAGDHARYGEVSARVMEIFARYTPLVEPISLDEAFLDVSGSLQLHGPAVGIARHIRRDVAAEEGLACSVGVAPSKLVAKLASEAAKPRASPSGPVPGAGVEVVDPDRVLGFLLPSSIGALWGVGPATLARLERLGVRTVGDLAALPEPAVVRGAAARGRAATSTGSPRGSTNVPSCPRGSRSQSAARRRSRRTTTTKRRSRTSWFASPTPLEGARLRRHGLAGRTVTLKVRFGDSRTITRASTLGHTTDSGAEISRTARGLLAALDPSPGVRLVGVSVSGLGPRGPRQLRFDDLVADAVDDAEDRSGVADRSLLAWEGANRAVDKIRDRFGVGAIGPGRTGARVADAPQAWGPDR